MNAQPDINMKYKNPMDMSLMDDILMCLVFDNCPEAAEEVLKIILNKDDLIIKEAKTQDQITAGISEKAVRLDVLASDSNGNLYDIEVQKIRKKGLIERSSYYSALLNLKSLRRGDAYLSTKHTFVIFICDFDYFGKGLSMYHVDRRIRELPDSDPDYPDKIIFVNGTYRNSDPIGLLMKDFYTSNASDITSKELKKRISYFKETQEGKNDMSEYIQRVYKDDIEAVKKKTQEDSAFKYAAAVASSLNISIEKALDILKCDDDLKAKILKNATSQHQA